MAETLAEALRDLLAVPCTDSRLGPVVTVADLERLLARHAPVTPPAPR